MRAPDRERLGYSVDGLQRLVRRERSPLFSSIITVLTLVILVGHTTPPDAAILGIYSAEDGDDANRSLLLASEALPPTGIAPLRTIDAGTPFLGDGWSAQMVRTLATVRDRAPPREHATECNTTPAPHSIPFASKYPPAWVVPDPVRASSHQVAASTQKPRDGFAVTQEVAGLVTGGRNRARRAGGRSPPRLPTHIGGGVTGSAKGDSPNTRGGDDERGKTA